MNKTNHNSVTTVVTGEVTYERPGDPVTSTAYPASEDCSARRAPVWATFLLMLVACTSSAPPAPDATELEACHPVEQACPEGMHAMSCFIGSACVFPGAPGEQDWVCCP